ncbi:hypothetical protein KY326_03575, partial [Candidatus Woesearchaeota archaeon]|nr:hypothetical protein [Candidatus Woesearchaeota archaeon]
MKKITILLTFLVIAIFITSCQAQQRVPPAPGAFQPTPIGEAGAALPTWAADAGNAISISPNQLTISPTLPGKITVSSNEDFVWRQFFVLELGLMTINSPGPAAWRQYNFPCEKIDDTEWCNGPVSLDINITTKEHFAGNNYMIAYTCDWQDTTQSFDCGRNRWKLANFWVNHTTTTAPPGTSTLASNVAAANVAATANLS